MVTLTGSIKLSSCSLVVCFQQILFCRSPWTNTYSPPLEDGVLPSDDLRKMEVEANELFDAYRELYYEGGTSSVYLWNTENGFAGCFLIKKRAYTLHCVVSRE